MLRVSIIIPVYNAAEFVTFAVESALAQPETQEVVLAEDGSKDNSLAICQSLAEKYDKVHLYRHPNGENRGAGAARNLAIRQSTCPYIAFLDADDFFLPGRFATAQRLFDQAPEVDGVYEAIGTHFQSDAAHQQWLKDGPAARLTDLTTVTASLPPERLFSALVQGEQGHFSGDGLVVKRQIFDKTGLFDEHLRLHQDSAMWIKMAAVACLVPGQLDTPVAMRRVHEHNRIASRRSEVQRWQNTVDLWRTVWRWSRQNLPPVKQELLFSALLRHLFRPYRNQVAFIRQGRSLLRFTTLPATYPDLLRTPYFWKLYLSRWLHYLGLARLIAATSHLRHKDRARTPEE